MVGGVRRNASTAAECICPTAVCNRSIGREFWTRTVRNVVRIHPNSGQVGPHKKHKSRERSTHFGYFLSGARLNSRAYDPQVGIAFPNCTALNHIELPPPLLSRRGQFVELSVTDVTDGNDQPPATAGMMDTPATVRGRGLQSLLEADVVVVHVHVDEPTQLALVVEHTGGDTGVVLLQVTDDLGEGAPSAATSALPPV